MKDFLAIVAWIIATLGSLILGASLLIAAVVVGFFNMDFAGGIRCEFFAIVFLAVGLGLVNEWKKTWVRKDNKNEEDNIF